MTELGLGVIPYIDLHLAPEALVVSDLFAFRADWDDAQQGADFVKRFLQGIFHPLTFGDVDKADDRPFDHIIDGAIGLNVHRVPRSLDYLHIFLRRGQVGPAVAFERKPTVSDFNTNYVWLAELRLLLEIKHNITSICLTRSREMSKQSAIFFKVNGSSVSRRLSRIIFSLTFKLPFRIASKSDSLCFISLPATMDSIPGHGQE